jgi:4-hydroxyphenylacetate 3-monooxygenase
MAPWPKMIRLRVRMLAPSTVMPTAWDLIGSEFAGRHLQYEKFYAGASFIVRNHSFREAPWGGFHKVVDDLMGTYDVPGR